jgi:hypothetical protein
MIGHSLIHGHHPRWIEACTRHTRTQRNDQSNQRNGREKWEPDFQKNLPCRSNGVTEIHETFSWFSLQKTYLKIKPETSKRTSRNSSRICLARRSWHLPRHHRPQRRHLGIAHPPVEPQDLLNSPSLGSTQSILDPPNPQTRAGVHQTGKAQRDLRRATFAG